VLPGPKGGDDAYAVLGLVTMGKDPEPTELSDDQLLNMIAARLGSKICRQRFGWPRKVCTLPKRHKGRHKA
jgi:hypothetical protein